MSQNIGSASIESLCISVMSGGTPSRRRDDYWTNGTIPWIKTGELKDCRIYDAEEKITEEGLASSSAKIFPVNTILMAMYGDGKTITSLGILENEVASNQACCAMIADPSKCDYRYLYYTLMHHRHKLLGLVVAGAQRNLSLGIIKRFPITTFPLWMQQRIASILSAYDDLIENNRRRIQLLEQAARLLYKEWFVHLRFPGHEHVKIKDGVPEGWEKGCVGNLAGVKSGFAFKSKDWQQEGNPVIKIKNILGDGTVSTINCDYVSDSIAEKAANFAIPIGSLLIAMTGATVGKVGIMSGSTRKFYLNQRVGLFKSRNNDPVERYLFPLFQEGFSQTQILNLAGGAAQPNISGGQIESIQLLIPDKKIFDLYLEATKAIFQQRQNLLEQTEKLAQARDLLLPRLMNGEVAA